MPPILELTDDVEENTDQLAARLHNTGHEVDGQ